MRRTSVELVNHLRLYDKVSDILLKFNWYWCHYLCESHQEDVIELWEVRIIEFSTAIFLRVVSDKEEYF